MYLNILPQDNLTKKIFHKFYMGLMDLLFPFSEEWTFLS